VTDIHNVGQSQSDNPSNPLPVLAILGGTGDLGTGLARRWAQAGYRVIIGSRTQDKAETAASALRKIMTERGVSGVSVEAMENLSAAQAADIITLTVPFSHQASTLETVKPALQGKILIDVTVPLLPPKVGRVQLPEQGSAGQIAQNLLGEETSVVSAFQNVAAHHLQDGQGLNCDVLVCGNSKEARAQVITLVEATGMRGFHAGPINNAAAAEALTSVIITINRQFKCHAGISITGINTDTTGS
jgi:8-hydroxy-5-deazaflavin:NADPH oxidoreductase